MNDFSFIEPNWEIGQLSHHGSVFNPLLVHVWHYALCPCRSDYVGHCVCVYSPTLSKQTKQIFENGPEGEH